MLVNYTKTTTHFKKTTLEQQLNGEKQWKIRDMES